MQVSEGGSAASVSVQRGTSQGSVNSGRLWRAGFEGILEELQRREILFVAFVDDQVTLARGNSQARVSSKAEEAVNAVLEWAERAKLQLNWGKTAMMVMKGKFDVRHPPRVRTNGRNLKIVNIYTYLGITISGPPHRHLGPQDCSNKSPRGASDTHQDERSIKQSWRASSRTPPKHGSTTPEQRK